MTYQGHRSRNAWNVALWINNDEHLYRAALTFVRDYKGNRRAAAEAFLEALTASSYDPNPKTPDGVPFTKTTIREAMRGMR